MAMSLRVVVPPHPLIGHWLTLLRDQQTPQPLYATAMAELGRWLTYEAIRDWLPHRSMALNTDLGPADGQVVDSEVPLWALPAFPDGLGLWNGAQAVLPAARVAHPQMGPEGSVSGLPETFATQAGALLFCGELGAGEPLDLLLNALQQRGLEGRRVRVVTALTASPGLQLLGQHHPDLTIYTACIDAELTRAGRILPGIGVLRERLFGWSRLEG